MRFQRVPNAARRAADVQHRRAVAPRLRRAPVDAARHLRGTRQQRLDRGRPQLQRRRIVWRDPTR